MSIDFEHSIEIEHPAAETFAFVADFANNPRWQQGMKSCRWTSETREVGGTYVQEAAFLGRRIDTHFRVTEFEPGRRISIESTVSTFPLQITRRVEARGEGQCTVWAHIRGQPTGFMALFGGMVRRSVARDYAVLKELLESL